MFTTKGWATTKHYCYATVFVDHYSGVSFVYLQKTISGEEMVEAKKAFKAYSRSPGVNIQHYHTDNGRFADNLYLNAVKSSGQTISFCGVNAHFQNGIAEKPIRDLQDPARTQLIHTKHWWPKAIEVSLWPYALWYANTVYNCTPTIGKLESPIELYSGLKIKPKIRHFHPFGCPVYVLHNSLQGNHSIPKWDAHS